MNTKDQETALFLILRGTRPLLYFWKVDTNLCTNTQ